MTRFYVLADCNKHGDPGAPHGVFTTLDLAKEAAARDLGGRKPDVIWPMEWTRQNRYDDEYYVGVGHIPGFRDSSIAVYYCVISMIVDDIWWEVDA